MSKNVPSFSVDESAAAGYRFAIAVSRWNAAITSGLTGGALACLHDIGVPDGNVEVFHCPGAFELPIVVKRLAQTGRFDAVIALGAVVRGDTPHFEYVASAATSGIASVALETGLPCIFGVLTTNTMEQALDRVGEGTANKGWEAVLTAVEMVSLLRTIPPAE